MSEIRTSDFDYSLPRELIAYFPTESREEARLMVLRRKENVVEHRVFRDIVSYLGKGDLLVLNDTKVIKARLMGRKKGTGGRVEILVLHQLSDGRWKVVVSPSRRIHTGTVVEFEDGETCRIVERLEGSRRIVEFSVDDVHAYLRIRGRVPLPPYIKRESQGLDEEMYQTVYARKEGAIAAPTAGLHFTRELLAEIEAAGVEIAYITLHVGMGSFVPVKTENPYEHELEPEYFEVGDEFCSRINEVRCHGGRVIAVGTTTVRTLETLGDRFAGEPIKPTSGWTGKFILPPYEFKLVDAMVTNFHLPRSTLLMLVCAFAGRDFILSAYQEAVKLKYRFFSYGDAMLIL